MTTRGLRLAYAVTIGAVAFAIAFLLGTPLNLALGPAMGGMINAVITAMIVAIGCKGVEKFPYATIIWLAFSLPAIFTPTMGPPGPHKILIALVTGLVMEVLFRLLGRRRWSYLVTGIVMSIVMTLGILSSMLIFGLDPKAAETLLKRLAFVLPLYGILGGIGMYLGSQIFDARIGNMQIVKHIRG